MRYCHSRQSLSFLRIRSQRQSHTEHAHDEEECIRLCMREGQLDPEQDCERYAEKHAMVPREADLAIHRTRSEIHRDGPNDTDGVETREGFKVCGREQD